MVILVFYYMVRDEEGDLEVRMRFGFTFLVFLFYMYFYMGLVGSRDS